ncbi:MAG: DUF3108 domain-containing protein [Gemmatimonadota bacterium]|nr:DUF3108 domain-containing protein [Gemmatimonadota bacterium]
MQPTRDFQSIRACRRGIIATRWTLALAIVFASPAAITAQTGEPAPVPAIDLRVGTATYKAKLELAGQSIPMDVTRTVKEVNGAWVVTETVVMPQGTISDEATLQKRTLLIQKRLIKQGPAVIDISYAGNKATGKMTVNGQDRPITADLGGVLFADGAGSNDVIATLPLADGYTANYRNFDIMTQQVKPRQIRVVGSESVTVPAGTFDTWKVETKPAEGTGEIVTLWVDKKTRVVAKSWAILPQMNGAVATSELVKSE